MRTSSSFSLRSCTRMSRNRHDAHQLAIVADGQVAETVAAHQRHTVFQIFVHTDGEGIIGHDLSHASAAGIAAFGES